MRYATLAAFAVVLFSGAAQAGYICNPGDTCISQIITGTITGGTDSGDGTHDDANLFNIGGGSTLGDTVTINIDYDLTSIQNNANGQVYYASGNGNNLENPASPNDYQISATLTGIGTTFAVNPDGSGFFVNYMYGYDFDGQNTYYSDGNEGDSLLRFVAYNTNSEYSTGDPTSTSQIEEILNDPTSTIQLLGTTNNFATFDALTLSGLQIESSTPEPTTCLSLATGLGGLALIKFRRSKSRG